MYLAPVLCLISICGYAHENLYRPNTKSCLYLSNSYLLKQGLMGRYHYPKGYYFPVFSDVNGTYYLPRSKVTIELGFYNEEVDYGIYMTRNIPYIFFLPKLGTYSLIPIQNSNRKTLPPEMGNKFPKDIFSVMNKKACPL